ncbi:MAG: divalent-cation tolerance protein CutA [Woeseiaceae bacterium]|nr:divalent-cation tolerance protein CutA [Woeseiaceae bacterium]
MTMQAVITTVDSLDKAQQIAAVLVERKLGACVQISRISSVYVWEGETRNDDEYRLLAKTRRDRYPDVEAAILEVHPYELPAIFAIDIANAYGPYAEWVLENAAGGSD